MEWKTNSCIAVVGKRGSGKSVFTREIVWKNLQKCVLHDRKFEHHFDDAVYAHTPAEFQSLWAQGFEKIIYQPYDSSYEDFDAVCKIIFDRGNTTFWIDEVGSVTTQNVCPHWYSELMRLGRIRGIGIVCVTQRPMGVSNLMFSEADLIVSFRLQLYNDAMKISQVAGERVIPIVMGLDQYYFIVSDGTETQICTPLQVEEAGFSDATVQSNENAEAELATATPGQ